MKTAETKTQTSYEIMMSIADRVTANLERLSEIEQIIIAHPEWVNADPKLKAVIATSSNPKLRSLA